MFINNLAYEASAGSGKTFMLVVRYLSLLFLGAKSSRILALTFTNKAASEMSERIVETLESLESRGELEEIVKVTQLSKEEILAKRDSVLEEFLNAHTKIMTIDSFFTQILRKFSLYASLMPDFSTFAVQHEIKLMSRFLLEVRVANKQNTLVHLALESKKRFGDIFLLLHQLYEKEEELTHLQFQKRDLHKFESAVLEAFDDIAQKIYSCKNASKTVLGSVDATTIEDIVSKSWISRESLDYRTFAKCYTPELDTSLFVLQAALREYFQAKEQNFFASLMELSALYKKSKKALFKDDSELSFSDVTALVYEILHLLDDSEFLYFRLDAKIEHILLDEFQDTSILQYKILQPLISEITSGAGVFENGSFFFVGDVKQSIYRFRGGVSALFHHVAQQNATHVEKLLYNYRSKREIVEFTNRTFLTKIKDYTSQLVLDSADGGYVSVESSEDLLESVVQKVKLLVEFVATLDDIAILCATNGDGEEIKGALVEEGLDVVTETTTKLIEQKSVKALLEYLKYLYFQKDIYRHNFFALIEQKIQKIDLIPLNKKSLLKILYDAIHKYNLAKDDFHLIRFLEVAAKYNDIEGLLFEYERLDTSAAASDLSGVRVLTVHKSKGLEYKHVIVVDRLKRKPPARDTIIYEYEGIRLKQIYLRTKSREGLDSDYALALQKERALVEEDTLNALYVAFTRAKENLFIIQKPKDSTFELLDLELREYGVLQKVPQKPLKTHDFEPLEYKDLYYGTQSDILELEKDEDDDLFAREYGIALHYFLEMLKDFSLKSITNAYEMVCNKFAQTFDDTELISLKRRVELLLADTKFLSLVDGKFFKEKSLYYKKKLRFLDLLVEKDDGSWVVIDYKSSFHSSAQHLEQVRFYIKAVREITQQEVQGYLVYLLDDGVKIVEV